MADKKLTVPQWMALKNVAIAGAKGYPSVMLNSRVRMVLEREGWVTSTDPGAEYEWDNRYWLTEAGRQRFDRWKETGR